MLRTPVIRAGAAIASTTLLIALCVAQSSAKPDDPRVTPDVARAALNRAEVHLRSGRVDAGIDALREAAEVAEQAGRPALSATIWNDLGTLEASESRFIQAIGSFNRAAEQAARAGNTSLAMRALANRARAAIDSGSAEGASQDLATVTEKLESMPGSLDSAQLLINVARSQERLAGIQRSSEPLLLAHAALSRALRIADETDDARTAAFALGYMATVYEADGRPQDALELTRRALLRAERKDARDTQYLWHAQLGRLTREQGDLSASLSAYRTSVQSLEELRPAAADLYGPAGSAFRRERSRIHLELVAVLLEVAAHNDAEAQAHLREAQKVLELRKADELRNYFQDDCVDAYQARRTDPAAVSRSARVIYPVLLPDRAVILVSGPDRIRQYRLPADPGEIAESSRRLRSEIVNRLSFEFLRTAKQLYAWLIVPILSELEAAEVETLVFVLEGPLQAIPMAALHDGERYLVERFAVAVTPGLELVDPRPIDRGEARAFVGGVSEAVQGFPPLPHVVEELEAIQDLYETEKLIDSEFTLSRIESALKSSYSIVHIATHAEFSGISADTFLLTFDGRLSLDQFADQVGRFRFRDQPLELITLSACETAVGDERAALGLAGLAIKSGARSALATLWQVNDEATARLVVAFYRNLAEPGMSRAEALRSAQIALLGDRRYAHPSYWAAFLLIGSWL
jgi:CHAT domain-containing protein